MRLFPTLRPPQAPIFSYRPFIRHQLIQFFRSELSQLGIPHPKQYAGHSFRSGGATDLYRAGVTVDMLKKLGRWRSNAVWFYIRDHQSDYEDEVIAALDSWT